MTPPPSADAHEAGQRFHAREPRAHRGVGRERDAALRRMRDVRVQRDVCQGALRPGQPGLCGERVFDERQQRVARRLGLAAVDVAPEERRHAQARRPARQLARGEREPALHARRRQWLRRQVAARRVVAQREIHQDGVAIGDQHAAVLEHGQLAQRVFRQELGAPVRPLREVHDLALER